MLPKMHEQKCARNSGPLGLISFSFTFYLYKIQLIIHFVIIKVGIGLVLKLGKILKDQIDVGNLAYPGSMLRPCCTPQCLVVELQCLLSLIINSSLFINLHSLPFLCFSCPVSCQQ